MNGVKIAAIVLIVAGALGLAYGSFTYTKETHQAKIGPIELSVKDKETSTSRSGSAWARSWRAARSCSSGQEGLARRPQPGRQERQSGLRPLITRSSTTTIAITSRTWIKPPMV